MCTWLTSELCPGVEVFADALRAAVPAVTLPAVIWVPTGALLGADVLGAKLLAAFPPAAVVAVAAEEDGRGAAGGTAACSGKFLGLAAAALSSAIALCTCGP